MDKIRYFGWPPHSIKVVYIVHLRRLASRCNYRLKCFPTKYNQIVKWIWIHFYMNYGFQTMISCEFLFMIFEIWYLNITQCSPIIVFKYIWTDRCLPVNRLMPKQTVRHFVDGAFKWIFVNGKLCILFQISLLQVCSWCSNWHKKSSMSSLYAIGPQLFNSEAYMRFCFSCGSRGRLRQRVSDANLKEQCKDWLWSVYRLADLSSHTVFVCEPNITWWRHQMEPFSALLAICAENSPVPGDFPAQRPVTRSFDVFFHLRLNKRLSKQSWGWRFETL